MAVVLFGLGLGVALAMLTAARLRTRRLAPILEAAPLRTVAELAAGRYRVVGRVVATDTTASAVDGMPCVFVEHAEYRTVGSELVPLLREVDHRTVAHPFYLDDGTGRILIDPGAAVVEAVTLTEDQGLWAERRLRAGEEVELLATFEPSGVGVDGGPYRAGHTTWQPIVDACGPPRLSYRTEPGMVVASDEVAMFLRGAAFLTLALTTLFASLSWL